MLDKTCEGDGKDGLRLGRSVADNRELVKACEQKERIIESLQTEIDRAVKVRSFLSTLQQTFSNILPVIGI